MYRYQRLSESASFCERYDKTFWCVFSFTILAAVHLQNGNAKFHKVWYRQYLGEVESVNISVWQIYLGHYVSNLTTIGQVLWAVYKNIFVFLGSQCIHCETSWSHWSALQPADEENESLKACRLKEFLLFAWTTCVYRINCLALQLLIDNPILPRQRWTDYSSGGTTLRQLTG